MNPARSLAPAVISGSMGDVWIYLAAPVLGGAVGVVTHKVVA
jgi:glycerol uptake facilitator-like aquaporin